MDPKLQSLPHGPEFRFVSAVEELVPGERAGGYYDLRGDEGFLAAHFPGSPMMPGVLMIEAVAQLGGILVQSDPAHPKMRNLLLTAVQNAKITGSAVPGERLEIRVKLTGRLGGLAMVDGEVTVGDRRVLTVRVTLSGEAADGN